uniref:Pyrroline-5-carboxylate reductase catalytic N-terminal domain-containing protein n=1 Tax=Gadus morhua TaxID=8049 RepID=A0A8C5CTM0_GADMO
MSLSNISPIVKTDPSMDMPLRVGFIGAGNMAYGIAKGILSGDVLPVNVKVSAPSPRNFGRFEELGISVTHFNSDVVSGSDLVFVAVKPHLVPEILREISQLVTQKHIIVSVWLKHKMMISLACNSHLITLKC